MPALSSARRCGLEKIRVPGFDGYEDVDVFCPSEFQLIATIQSLLDQGCKPDPRFDRVWARWLKMGFKGWHTNSMRLTTPRGTSLNLVYKTVGGKPLTSLSQVIESFDFGLLGQGMELETHTFRDLKPYLFPGMSGAYPLMPDKQDNWKGGFISQYNGLRESYRYAKYHQYGFDMSLIAPDLVQGYLIASAYHAAAFDEDRQILAEIYTRLAELISTDGIDELLGAYQQLGFSDQLDEILKALE